MSLSSPEQQSPGFIFLSVSIITFLILLINVSFKIILWQGLVFTVSSLVCPLIACLYLFILRNATVKEQRYLLNSSLTALYLFCIGIFVLVNLPGSEYMQDNQVYRIIFEAIPKKFFATTLSFALSFYLPHLLFCRESGDLKPKQCVSIAMLGGIAFFSSDFYFLFSGPHAHHFQQIFIDSFMVALLFSLLISVTYLCFNLNGKQNKPAIRMNKSKTVFPIYYYLLCLAVIVMLMCLACEYRIVAFSRYNILTASCIFFPIAMIISTIISELWGYKPHFKLIAALIGAQLIFDTCLMGIVALPSPHFFDLNPFYSYIVPQRLPAASLSLLVTFLVNSLLLHYLQQWKVQRPVRIIIANICASSLLCFVDYSLLFGGIYTYEQVVRLATHVWRYKLVTTLLFLPVVLWLCKLWEKENPFFMQRVRSESS